MKKLLLVTAGLLAISVSAAGAQEWNGFYVGAYAGVGTDRSRSSDPTAAFPGGIDLRGSGLDAGGLFGVNWHYGRNWVFGIEGDFGALRLSDGGQTFNNNTVYTSEISWIATLRGRAGWSNGPTLNYVTAGAAWAKIDESIRFTAGVLSDSTSKIQSGYALGSGTETMLGGNWSAKSEYLYVDLGRGHTLDLGVPVQYDHRYHMQRFGLNYRFGGGAAQPKLTPYNWSGVYVGLVGGSAVASSRAIDPTGFRNGQLGINDSAYTAGGQTGINWQFAPSWLAGIEGDFSWAGIDRTTRGFDTNIALGTETRWIATLRGRLAYSTGPALLYVTGGGAWVKLRETYDAFGNPTQTGTKTLSGYSVGGGIETVLAGNLVNRTEYLYVDVGKGGTFPDGAGGFVQADHKFHLFRSAITYKFGG